MFKTIMINVYLFLVFKVHTHIFRVSRSSSTRLQLTRTKPQGTIPDDIIVLHVFAIFLC